MWRHGNSTLIPHDRRWPAYWANVLRLGLEMGEEFPRGLRRAAGVTTDELDLSWREETNYKGDKVTVCTRGYSIDGDRPTAILATTECLLHIGVLSRVPKWHCHLVCSVLSRGAA